MCERESKRVCENVYERDAEGEEREGESVCDWWTVQTVGRQLTRRQLTDRQEWG